jgi:hypothetical protein
LYNRSHGWWSGQSRWAAAIPDGDSIGDVVDGTGFPTNRGDAPWVQARTGACFRVAHATSITRRRLHPWRWQHAASPRAAAAAAASYLG